MLILRIPLRWRVSHRRLSHELQKKLEESEKAVKNAKNSRNDANTKLAIQKEELKKAEKVED